MPSFKEFNAWWNETLGKSGTLTLLGHTFPDAIHAFGFLKALDAVSQEAVLKTFGIK